MQLLFSGVAIGCSVRMQLDVQVTAFSQLAERDVVGCQLGCEYLPEPEGKLNHAADLYITYCFQFLREAARVVAIFLSAGFISLSGAMNAP